MFAFKHTAGRRQWTISEQNPAGTTTIFNSGTDVAAFMREPCNPSRRIFVLEFSYNFEPDEDGVFDGRDIARQMITDAYKLLAIYASDDPEKGRSQACADQLFETVANEIEAGSLLGEAQVCVSTYMAMRPIQGYPPGAL